MSSPVEGVGVVGPVEQVALMRGRLRARAASSGILGEGPEMVDAFEAAVRAEAVAEERQRLADAILPGHWQTSQMWGGVRRPVCGRCRYGDGVCFLWPCPTRRALTGEPAPDPDSAALAAGSVPVATPPEPTVEIGGVTMTQRQYDAARYPLLHPPTCEHGQTAGHWWPPGPEGYEVCPGPVATPAEPELPAGWYHRHGTDEESGRRFVYCEARGPVRAHCVRPRHGESEGTHQWAWFTVEDRTEAESVAEPSVGTPATEDVDAVPISPELRQRLIAAAERPLRESRAVLLLAGHASGHLPGAQHACRECHTHWPCEAVHRAAQPALEAFAECDASLAASVGTGTPAEAGGFEPAILGPGTVVRRRSPAEAVSGGSGHAERQGTRPAEATMDQDAEGAADQIERWAPRTAAVIRHRSGIVDLQRRHDALADEVARYRAAIEAALNELRPSIAGLNRTENINFHRHALVRGRDVLAAALGDGE